MRRARGEREPSKRRRVISLLLFFFFSSFSYSRTPSFLFSISRFYLVCGSHPKKMYFLYLFFWHFFLRRYIVTIELSFLVSINQKIVWNRNDFMCYYIADSLPVSARRNWFLYSRQKKNKKEQGGNDDQALGDDSVEKQNKTK